MLLEQRLAGRRRTALDDLELELGGLADDVLRARDIGHAGELDHDLVLRLTVAGDVGLGHAQVVDPAVDRLERLHHGLFTHLDFGVRLHREDVAAVRLRAAVVVLRDLVVGDPAELGVAIAGDAVDPERLLRGQGDAADIDAGRPQALAELLARRGSEGLQGIAGLDAHDEVHASLEVEPEPELLGHQPSRGREAVALRQQRVDAEGREQHEGDRNGHDFPTKVLDHD